MSEERELLQRILDTDPKFLGGRFIAEIQDLLAQPEQDLREDLREEISLRDATNDGLRKEIASLRTANDRQEADLRLAKTALAETMKLFNNQPNDSGLRDHFAGLAMQALLSSGEDRAFIPSFVAENAYMMADAMLAEREKKDDSI